jgi:hypothetical protein
MFELLDYVATMNILEHLDCQSLRNLSKYSKHILQNYNDYIYYRHAMENELVDSLDYFIKGVFGQPIFNNQPLNNLFYYISGNDALCIAGGFPTQLYMGNIPKDTSDIDIYVLGGLRHSYSTDDTRFLKKHLLDVYNLLEFIYSNYSDIRVKRIGSNVYTITVREFTHPIQIILTIYSSLAEVLSSFDNSHNRCGMYKNDTYIGIDARLSHSTKTTYFYTPAKASRYIKAANLGFNIFGLNDKEMENIMDIAANNNNIDTDIGSRNTPNGILRTLLKDARAVKNWKVSYSAQRKTVGAFDKVLVDMTIPLNKDVKRAIYNGVGIRDFPKLRTAILPKVILKSPNSAFLKIKKPVLHNYKYTVIGKPFYTNTGFQIKVFEKAELEKMKTVKSNMLEIFQNYHKVSQTPDRIGNCRTLTSWDEFYTYREEIEQPFNVSDMTSVLKLGFEYDDCIRSYNDRVIIKGFLEYPLDLTGDFYMFQIETKPLLKEYCTNEYSECEHYPFSWGFYENNIISISQLFY